LIPGEIFEAPEEVKSFFRDLKKEHFETVSVKAFDISKMET
jgi:hypothetical protein